MKVLFVLVLIMLSSCTVTRELTINEEQMVDQECALKNSVPTIHDVID